MEKYSEKLLNNIIDKINIDDFVYYTPNSNPTLKKLFANTSKNKNRGIPDRIIFDNDIIVVIECKTNIDKTIIAKNQLLRYSQNIKLENSYYVSFVDENTYNIYDKNFIELNITLIELLNKFKKQSNQTDTNQNMEKEIHNIHNYIRDNTKISNEDKPFFISIILIALKKESFKRLIDNYDQKSYIYDLLNESLKDFDIDISVFYFMKNDNNNKFLLNLVNLIRKILDKNPNEDVLNKFYTEFVRYNNNDSKSLGIVLTPPHIIELMNFILDIKSDDVVLDLCTGTGSFLLEALKYNPKKIIGCEYQNKLFTLLKCNMILRDIDNYEIIKDDCFARKFSATKSLINPPYGMKTKKELEFLMKQLECVDEGGLVCAIIPISNIKNVSNLRSELINKAVIKLIIKCSEKLFYPSAGVSTAIILLEKNSKGHQKEQIRIIDYTNDGFSIQRGKGKVKNDDYNIIFENIKREVYDGKLVDVNLEGDWLGSVVKSSNINLVELRKKLLEIEYNSKTIELMNMKIDRLMDTKFKVFKIIDLFDILKKPTEKYEKKCYVNLISAKNNNNGICDIVIADENTFTGNKIVLVVSGDGGAGLAFYQENDFKIKSATVVLSPKIPMDKYSGIYIATELSKYKSVYSRGYTWSMEKIKNDTINLPVDGDEIDYTLIRKFYG